MDVLGNYIQVWYVVRSINECFIKKNKSLFIPVKVILGVKSVIFYTGWNYNRYSKSFFLHNFLFPIGLSIPVLEMA